MKKRRPIIGITIGDPAGIGPEITVKALKNPSIRRLADFKIIGHADFLHQIHPIRYKNCSFFPFDSFSPMHKVVAGQPNHVSANASLLYLQKAVKLFQMQKCDALVTAPVSKESINQVGFKFSGHTEFLAQSFQVKKYEMMFVSRTLKIVIMTRHIPLNDVSQSLTKRKIFTTLELVNNFMKKFCKIKKPRLAVCGLNPHAGENGYIGQEEGRIILPAIKKAQRDGLCVYGPFPADTLFYPEASKQYDVIFAMYHDQGLTPIKTLFFKEVVNLTVGLPFIRTSPAHGTAFNIAGKNLADSSSMQEAIKWAVNLS